MGNSHISHISATKMEEVITETNEESESDSDDEEGDEEYISYISDMNIDINTLPLNDIVGRTMLFLTSPKDFLNFILISKRIYEYVYKNVECCKNIEFVLKSEKKQEKKRKGFSFKLIRRSKKIKNNNIVVFQLKLEENLKSMTSNINIIKKFPNIQKLSLEECCIPIYMFDYFAEKKLIELKLTLCTLQKEEGVEFGGFVKMKHLKVLEIKKIGFVKEEHISCLNGLDSLNINNCENIKNFTFVRNVKELVLKGCKNLSDKKMKDNVQVQKLFLIDCESIKGKLFELCLQLEELHIKSNTVLNDQIFNNCAKLKVLSLKYCSSVIGSGFRKLTLLEELTIEYNLNIVDNVFDDLQNLKKLSLSQCQSIVGSVFKDLKLLENLSLSYCNKITNESITLLNKLKRLSIFSCSSISDLQFMEENSLEKLTLEMLDIDDNAFDHLSKLKNLKIRRCMKISKNFEKLTSLSSLSVQDNHRIKFSEIEKISSLQELYVIDCRELSKVVYSEVEPKTKLKKFFIDGKDVFVYKEDEMFKSQFENEQYGKIVNEVSENKPKENVDDKK